MQPLSLSARFCRGIHWQEKSFGIATLQLLIDIEDPIGFHRGPSVFPIPDHPFFSKSCVGHAQNPAPLRSASLRFAPLRSASPRFAPPSHVSLRFAPMSFASARLALQRFAPLRS